MEIVKINDFNYEETLEAYKTNFANLKLTLKDDLLAVMGCMPYKHEIVGQFILDLLKVHDIKEVVIDVIKELVESESIVTVISGVIYAKVLNFDVLFEEFKIKSIENSPFKGLTFPLSEVKKIKILEYLERIRQFVLRGSPEETTINQFIYFFCISIVKNFKFSTVECVKELNELTVDDIIFTSIIFLTDEEEHVYLFSLLLKLIKPNNYHFVLSLFDLMDKAFRDFFIAMAHENYLQKKITKDENWPFNKPEDLVKVKSYIDEETVDVLLRFISPSSLTKFIPEYKDKLEVPPIRCILKKDFLISSNKEKFFKDFCLLGSPSVSHFLSYLEIYKDYFRLNKDEQRLFLKVFYGTFVNRKSFNRIVLGKMALFGMLDKNLI